MATAGGPKIVTDGLVFGYDTNYGVADPGVSTRFYSGKPTVNLGADRVATLHDSSGSAAATVVDAPEKGAGWKKVTITARGTNFRVIQFGSYVSFAANTLYSESFEADWGNMRGKGYSLTFDGSGGGTTNWFKNRSYTTGVTSAIVVDNTLLDGHIGGNITKSSTHVHVWFLYNYSTSTTGLNDYFYYKDLQIELGTIPTPFVNGTRSSTASLIDLKETTDIDVSNVSFDSTGQPEFDGTNDVITTSFPATTISTVTIEAVVYRNQATTRYEAIVQNNNAGDDALYVNPSGFLMFWPCSTSSLAVPTGQWSHVAVSYNGTTLTYIVNGTTQVVTATCTDITDWDFLRIGGHGTTDSERWIGKIAVAKVYEKSLSAAELIQNYNAYKNRFDI